VQPDRVVDDGVVDDTGAASAGRTMSIARQGLCAKTLLVMRGAEPLMKDTTPERNWVSQELLRNTLPSMVGEATLPPMAAP
jgi:hypothetical protein